MLNAQEIYHLLLDTYGKPRWWSDAPFTVMFQSILVQNTNWSIVEKTCAPLGDKLTPEYIGSLPTEELERLISPCGFYKAKVRTIQALITWYSRYRFDCRAAQAVPMAQLREELLSIRGIGPETADVILVYAFFQPSFVIDAYTRRFLSRLGYEFADDTSLKNFFEAELPRDAQIYGWYHWLILEHCIGFCKKEPKCGKCKFRPYCRLGYLSQDTSDIVSLTIL
ncbi:MAG: endonuclease [Clostridium sp.]|nr:endonuclease [Clostridium sp.]